MRDPVFAILLMQFLAFVSGLIGWGLYQDGEDEYAKVDRRSARADRHARD